MVVTRPWEPNFNFNTDKRHQQYFNKMLLLYWKSKITSFYFLKSLFVNSDVNQLLPHFTNRIFLSLKGLKMFINLNPLWFRKYNHIIEAYFVSLFLFSLYCFSNTVFKIRFLCTVELSRIHCVRKEHCLMLQKWLSEVQFSFVFLKVQLLCIFLKSQKHKSNFV